MAVSDILPVTSEDFDQTLAAASPDLLRFDRLGRDDARGR